MPKNPRPPGHNTVTPVIAFLERAFGGNMWSICSIVEVLTHDEINERMASQKH